jgi:hypothetical protein
MAKNIRAIAERLGAEIVGPVPDVGGGAFGAARLAQVVAALRQRPREQAEPSRGPAEVPLSEAAIRKLTRLAEQASTPERKVSPMQVAARLIEEAVAGLPDE